MWILKISVGIVLLHKFGVLFLSFFLFLKRHLFINNHILVVLWLWILDGLYLLFTGIIRHVLLSVLLILSIFLFFLFRSSIAFRYLISLILFLFFLLSRSYIDWFNWERGLLLLTLIWLAFILIILHVVFLLVAIHVHLLDIVDGCVVVLPCSFFILLSLFDLLIIAFILFDFRLNVSSSVYLLILILLFQLLIFI